MIDEREYRQQLMSAQLVQIGLLPKKRHFDRLFSNSFVLFLPKDIISGDFYWVGQKHGRRYLVVGDCTGHGVSASLTSVLALNLLEYIIMNKGIKRTHHILGEMDKRYIDCFMDAENTAYDNPWIDLAIVSIDDEQGKIYFSSANRKLHVVRKTGESETHSSNGCPIGGWQIQADRSFEATILSFEKGDRLYLGSDGFQDQFGGSKNKKFLSKNLHNLLSMHHFPDMEMQKNFLHQTHVDWKGDVEQTDDICIVGVEL